MDEDAFHAGVDLVGRTGAAQLEFGYLHDHVPVHLADWWASATYRGARVHVEHHEGPAAAVNALAERLLIGGRCKCGCLVSLSDDGAVAFDSHMADGSFWSVQAARKAGLCRWRRDGQRWTSGCTSGTGVRAGGSGGS
ncbi:hypothetical protein [Amycolatopsis palatopharyngis]|uniref:hypothetical protein n=1 Tax=Amycolatopsis palatopharyngis TaxID=187982 RepID=UPI000E26FB55|nr:hypothetical protein [Amycolatopsis palatopharyngis]